MNNYKPGMFESTGDAMKFFIKFFFWLFFFIGSLTAIGYLQAYGYEVDQAGEHLGRSLMERI